MATSLPRRTLVVPSLPPIDKYIAAKRVLLDWEGIARFDVAFCDVNVPGPEHYKLWDGDNPGSAILIDLGDEKYHSRCMSASEMQKMKSSVENGATWNKLMQMANRNNTDGYLKQPRYAIAKMIREIPHVFQDRKKGELETWNYGMDVVNSYFWRQHRREWETLFTDPMYAALRRIWDGFGVNDQELGDFTLPLYFRRMFRAGTPEAEIVRRMSWWIDHAKQVTTRHEKARRTHYNWTVIGIPKTDAKVGLIQVNDYFEAGAFTFQQLGSGNLAAAIIRNRFGGAVIMSSSKHRVDLSKVAAKLSGLEPTRWYFEQRFASGHMLMNQSWQFIGVTPTALADAQLMHELISGIGYVGRK